MTEPRVAAKADRLSPVVAWVGSLSQSVLGGLAQAGTWAVDTAQKFASLVSILMGPAILSLYAFAAWSLTAELGWTDSFPFQGGPLSNWMIWTGLAVLLHIAASILRRRQDRS